MKVGITPNFTHIILYCILKVIGFTLAHSLVPPLETLPSYITGQVVPPTQCSTKSISVCETFLSKIMCRLLDDIKSNSCVKYHVY